MLALQLTNANNLPSFVIPGDQVFAGGPQGPGIHASIADKVEALMEDFEEALEAWQVRARF